jgi:serine/threonine protein kinase
LRPSRHNRFSPLALSATASLLAEVVKGKIRWRNYEQGPDVIDPPRASLASHRDDRPMTIPRAPGESRPDLEAVREATASLTARPDGFGHSLAMGTAEKAKAQQPSLDVDEEERTKVDVAVARVRPPRPPDPDDGTSRIGTTLGSYYLLACIGKGGMGYVYRAKHIRLGREVAIKLLRNGYAKRKDAVARFFQEARTVNRVRHRNIIDVTDFVELEDGTTFIIMELLIGQSLGRWVRSGIEMPRALAVLVQICDGLAAAHAVSVVHRDLKPDNVIVTQTSDGAELVKLLDFGVAKLINQADEDVGFQTAAGAVVGTPAYMSPEQAGGLPIDGRSDIYSLGAMMYELFCGQTMFRGQSFGEFVRKHLMEQPIAPRATHGGADLDPRIEAIILRAVEKDPARRFQHIVELRDALAALLRDLPAPALISQQLPVPVPRDAKKAPVAGSPSAPASAPLLNVTMESLDSLSGSRASSAQPRTPQHSPLYYAPATTHVVRGTPGYLWFVGGALAVAVGIGGASWYARSSWPPPEAVARPEPARSEPARSEPARSSEPARPKPVLIEIRLRSVPSESQVYRDGSATELCRTPCLLNLDPAEPGATMVRPFVLRRDGYVETSLAVDLSGAQRDFTVALAPLPVLVVAPEVNPGEDSTAAPEAAPDQEVRPGKRSKARDRKNRRRQPEPTDSGSDPTPEPSPSVEPEPRSPAAVDPEPAAPPVETKPETPAVKPVSPGKINRSETIDPFRTKP